MEKTDKPEATYKDRLLEINAKFVDLELHELMPINYLCDVMRVHGGWIYVFYSLINTKDDALRRNVNISHTQFVQE